ESILSKNWQFDAQIYVWAVDFGGEMDINGGTSFDVPFSTMVDNLKMGFYGSFEARKEKWLIFTDVVYLNVETDHADAPEPPNIIGKNRNVRSISMNGGAVNLVGGYNLLAKGKSRLDLIAGARYLDLGSELAFNISSPDETTTEFWSIDMGTALDAVIGVKGKYAFAKADRWSIPYYLDIGAGDSDFTWQALTGISYQAANWVDVALTYRHMEWDLKSTDGILKNVNFSGPSFGATFHF
ncbi:MAG: hypothetical protein DRQ44_13460, partial [Gammaproteobacteria bacterium]